MDMSATFAPVRGANRFSPATAEIDDKFVSHCDQEMVPVEGRDRDTAGRWDTEFCHKVFTTWASSEGRDGQSTRRVADVQVENPRPFHHTCDDTRRLRVCRACSASFDRDCARTWHCRL